MDEDATSFATRRKRTTRPPKPSASHYVGYVEDDESVDAIMKKFEELERIQRQSRPSLSSALPSDADHAMQENTVDGPISNNGLTDEQLEEVFKHTSAFTIPANMGFTPDEYLFHDDIPFELIDDGNIM